MNKALVLSGIVVFACCAPVIASSSGPKVIVTEKASSVTLDNGIVAIEVAKKTGDLLSLSCRGTSILSQPAYLDWHTGVNNHIRAGETGLRVDPAENGGEMAEISISQKYSGSGAAFDVELHYVLRRGDTGFYAFAVFGHPEGHPPAEIAQARMVFRVRDELFDFINVDDKRRRLMPPSDTPYKELGPKESIQFTGGPFSGQVSDKYHFFADAGEHFVHGWSGTKTNIGCWLLYGGNEDQNGGPTKQHNTAHFERILLKILTCSHYGAAGIKVGTESWQKMYGPWMIYVNRAESNDALWADAKKKAADERAAWPYSWMKHPLYPVSGQRGTVRGTLSITDPQAPEISSSNAWVGLAAPAPDWQQQSRGYQFWVRSGAGGRFTIPNIRPGSYTLYAFADGVMGEFRRDDVKVSPGQVVDLGALEWKPIRYGRQLWQIGVPDRTAREFRHGDDHRQWGLWQKYLEEFPDHVNFVVGRSVERRDWNYAQVTVPKNGRWVGTNWSISFNVSSPLKPGRATLRIAVAAAQNAVLRVTVNGVQVAESRRLGNDNAVARAGIHGQYSVWDVRFDSALLKLGDNRITLEQQEGGSPFKNVMYDCLRLELPD
jgi:rhamnogalacturonan endolyase